MNWLARLKNQEAPGAHPTKPTKPGFVGFVAPIPGQSQNFGGVPDAGLQAEGPPPPNWRALHARYMAHHWRCPDCCAGGQGTGQRCGPGAAMWAAYAEAVGSRGAAWLSEAFEERAAIMKFGGGMTRADAEAATRLEL